MATNEEHTPRILSDESDTRYIELSTQFEQDVYWHPSVTITLRISVSYSSRPASPRAARREP